MRRISNQYEQCRQRRIGTGSASAWAARSSRKFASVRGRSTSPLLLNPRATFTSSRLMMATVVWRNSIASVRRAGFFTGKLVP